MLNKGIYPPLEYVRFLGKNAFSENMERDIKYLKFLDCDRMLYNFRKTFGAETDAEPIYGWDSHDGLLRGHSTGHYISALAIAYSATKDNELLEKLNYMISELRKLQLMSKGSAADFKTVCTPYDCKEEKWSKNPAEWGEGFLAAYSPDQFALLEQFTRYANIWAPYYTLHKLIAGFVEAYERTGNKEALEAACGIGDWVYTRLSTLDPEHRKKMWSMYIAGEFGGMNETLARLYYITGEKRYLDCARMFDNENIFPGLANCEDTIKNLHANQHIPQILGAMLEYKACGEDYYYKIAENFFDIVTHHHMYSIGGVGQGESFREPDMQAHFIKGDTNCETCATYNMVKLARELYSYMPDSAEYMDYCERGIINHILASQSPEVNEHMKHGVTYMMPIGPGTEKSYSNDYWAFTCCHGTGMENHVKYPDTQYFIAENNVYINQYFPTALDFNGIKIETNVAFPFGCGTVKLSGYKDFICKLRVPEWCGSMPFFDKTGTPLELYGRYAVISHKAGETEEITVKFKYDIRYEYTPDSIEEGKLASIMYGPFVMVTYDNSEKYIDIPADSEFTVETNREAGSFYLICRQLNRIFIPIYKAHGKPYHTYFTVK